MLADIIGGHGLKKLESCCSTTYTDKKQSVDRDF